MNKPLRMLISLCLALSVVLCIPLQSLASSTTVPPSLDYSIAEKMFRQLEAGSGFSGTLSFSLTANPGREGEAVTTTEPLSFDVDYIYVREDAATNTAAEHRYDMRYPAGDASTASLAVSVRDGAAYLKSTLLGEGWYNLSASDAGGSLSAPVDGEAGVPDGSTEAPTTTGVSTLGTDIPPDGEATQPTGTASATPASSEAPAVASANLDGLFSQTSMPSLFSFFLPLLLESGGYAADEQDDPLPSYETKIDLWIEGYRQDAVLGKLADGTSTMEVNYAIPPAAIKSQLKQMVLDLLADPAMTAKLQAILLPEQAEMMLNPAMQSYYFFAIDELLLEDELTISRTVSLKGETLALHMRLPLYDKEGGKITISYDRDAGEGDLPDENVVSLESETVALRLEYQEYSTMTDVTVYQGEFLRQPKAPATTGADAGGGTVSDAASLDFMQKTLSLAFSLTHQQTSGTDEEERETLMHDFQLTMEPLLSTESEAGEAVPLTAAETETYITFPAFEAKMNAVFASKQAKNAATSVDMTLNVNGDELAQQLDVTFSGKTKAKWTPDAINTAGATSFFGLSSAEQTALLGTAGLQLGVLLLPKFTLPQGGSSGDVPATTDDTTTPTEGDTTPSAPVETPPPDANPPAETENPPPSLGKR